MIVIGLTGKTGSGKSTISGYLSKKGFYIIDGDKIASDITKKGSPVLPKLAEVFGDDIIKYGELDRKLLAFRAFSSRENTDRLNQITHPEIRRITREKLQQAQQQGYAFAVIDAAALLDSSCKEDCDFIAVVYAPETVRLQRIRKRDGISDTEARIRMHAQKSDEFYAEHADIILINDTACSLENEIGKLTDFAERFEKRKR